MFSVLEKESGVVSAYDEMGSDSEENDEGGWASALRQFRRKLSDETYYTDSQHDPEWTYTQLTLPEQTDRKYSHVINSPEGVIKFLSLNRILIESDLWLIRFDWKPEQTNCNCVFSFSTVNVLNHLNIQRRSSHFNNSVCLY